MDRIKKVSSLSTEADTRGVLKKAVLTNIAIFTGRRLCWILFVIKLQAFPDVQVCNFIKKGLQLRNFPVNIPKLLRTPILKNICEWLLLFITCIPLECRQQRTVERKE